MDAKAEARVHLLIPRLSAAGRIERLYLLPAIGKPGCYALPAVAVPEEPGYTRSAPAVRAALREAHGLDATVLFWLAARRAPEANPEEWVAVMELAPGEASGGGAWVALNPRPTVRVPGGALQTAVDEWLAESANGRPPALRAAWARPGWLAGATAWIDRALASEGAARTGPVEQVKTWSLSALLRVPATTGDYFYKSVPPLFAREPRLTAELARQYPGEIPDVVAVDEARHAMLMRAFTPNYLEAEPDQSVWQAALRRYAEIQIESARDLDRWLALGCADRRLPVLREQIDPLLADTDAMIAGRQPMRPDEMAALRALAPQLKAACDRLAASGVPATLEHGDLHANNIALDSGRSVYFDWTDGCVTHPFFCWAAFLETVLPERHAALEAAYLAPWQAALPHVDTAAVLRAARPLAALHLAVSYHDIRQSTEPLQRWELAGALPFFLRQILVYKSALA